MTKIFIGIDIAKVTFTVAVKTDHQYEVKEFKNSLAGCQNCLAWVKKRGDNEYYFCMESTGKYGHLLATFLYEHGYYVSVVNPTQIKYFMKSQLARNKTDSVDAKMIAHFAELCQPLAWQPLSDEITQLQALINRIDVLEKLVLQEKNRLKELPDEITIFSVKALLEHLTGQINQVHEQIKKHVEQYTPLHEKLDLLKTIPGMGDKTSQRILAFFGDITRFTHPKQLTAYIGLNPRQRQSGNSIKGCSGISRIGNAYLRKSLYIIVDPIDWTQNRWV